MTFSIVDIVLICIAIIIGVLGLKKGFVKEVGKFLCLILAIVAGVLLCKLVSGYVYGFSFVADLEGAIQNWIGGKSEEFLRPMNELGEEGFYSCLTSLKIPQFLQDAFVKNVGLDFANLPSEALNLYLADKLTKYICYASSFIVILIVALIALNIVLKILSKFFKATGLGFINKLLGMGLALAKFVVVIWIIFYASTFLLTIPAISSYIDIAINDYVLTSTIGKYLYENNMLIYVISNFL